MVKVLEQIGGVLVYLHTLFLFIFLVLFLGNLSRILPVPGSLQPYWDVAFPTSIDHSLFSWGSDRNTAILVDVALLLLFCVQHTILCREWFRNLVARWEWQMRTTFVVTGSCFSIHLLLYRWEPLPEVIWKVDQSYSNLMYVLYALGWAMVVIASFNIDHLDSLGVKPSFVGRKYRRGTKKEDFFKVKGLYRLVRHPQLAGLLLLLWSTPVMTLGHLLMAGIWSVYIVIGVQMAEKRYLADFGEKYRIYQQTTPQLIPFTKFGKSTVKTD